MYEEWEIRYFHDKDRRDSQCESEGFDIPNEEHGVLIKIKGLWNTFHGEKFWKIFRSKGHTSADYDECICNPKNNKKGVEMENNSTTGLIDIKQLQKYLLTLSREDFEDSWHKEGVIYAMKISYTDEEILNFKINPPISQIIKLGDYFLCDALGNDLSILQLTKRKYKLPTGRSVNAKYIITVIPDCHAIYGTALNGCWIIPERFFIDKFGSLQEISRTIRHKLPVSVKEPSICPEYRPKKEVE